MSQWVGVNVTGTTTYPIVQAGADTYGDSNLFPAVWIEAFPASPIFPNDFKSQVVHGSVLFVHVNLGSTGVAAFHIIDLGSGIDRSYQLSTGGHIDGHAEFIDERPTIYPSGGNPYYPTLTNFSTVEYTNAEAAAGGHWYTLGSLSNYYYYMQNDAGTLMAQPGSVFSNYDFYDYFHNAGEIDPVGPC